MELNSLRSDRQKLETIRLRLSDIGWWMRLLCQHIAVRANREDNEVGKFWQSRFRAVRLLDEAAVLACSAYVDLNPIRAGVAKTLETSDFTSAQRRIQSLPQGTDRSGGSSKQELHRSHKAPAGVVHTQRAKPADGFLSPVRLNERSDAALGPRPCRRGGRCSDKGYLPLSTGDYLLLLDWTARQVIRGKRGVTPKTVPPVFKRLGLDVAAWSALVLDFGRLFRVVAGRPKTVETTRSRVHQHRFHLGGQARSLLAALN